MHFLHDFGVFVLYRLAKLQNYILFFFFLFRFFRSSHNSCTHDNTYILYVSICYNTRVYKIYTSPLFPLVIVDTSSRRRSAAAASRWLWMGFRHELGGTK